MLFSGPFESVIDAGKPCLIEIQADLGPNVLFCWVDTGGHLHHYHPVPDGSIHDSSVPRTLKEYTQSGHVFVLFERCHPLPRRLDQVSIASMRCVYRPKVAGHHLLTLAFKLQGRNTDCVVGIADGSEHVRVRRVTSVLRLGRMPNAADVIDTTSKRYHETQVR